MAQIHKPTTLRGWSVVLNGNQKAGLVKEGNPPKIVKKMEEYRNAGMFQTQKAWLGMEAQEVEVKIEVNYYKWSYDGQTIHEFDPDNLLYVFDGEDALKGLREIIVS